LKKKKQANPKIKHAIDANLAKFDKTWGLWPATVVGLFEIDFNMNLFGWLNA